MSIDTATGAATVVGSVGFDRVFGLAFQASTGKLFGAADTTDQLIEIDPSTGQGTAIGDLGFERVWSLTFEPISGTLYGMDVYGGNTLLTIDTSTGAATAVGPNQFSSVEAMTVIWDDCNGNGIPDETDIAVGSSFDTNGNGIPDEADCDVSACVVGECLGSACVTTPVDYGDTDLNGTVNLFDLFCVLDAFDDQFESCTRASVDVHPCEGNGTINLLDLFGVINAFDDADPCCGS